MADDSPITTDPPAKLHRDAGSIDALGSDAVERQFRVTAEQVAQWRLTGVPRGHRARFLTFARTLRAEASGDVRRPRPWHKHAEMVDLIGWDIVAARYGLSPQRLAQWRVHGIPWTHRAHFAAFAREYEAARGFRVPADFVTPPDLPAPPRGKRPPRQAEAAE
jgi:hypothetical protein